MKRIVPVLILCLILLSSCGVTKPGQEPEGTEPSAEPAVLTSPEPEEDLPEQEDNLSRMPVSAERAAKVRSYTYDPLSVTDSNYTMEHPSSWQRIPGTNSICYTEVLEEGEDWLPARVVMSRKVLKREPSANTKTTELTAFLKQVIRGFDSYELGILDTDMKFLEDKNAFGINYTCTSGSYKYRGYALMAGRGTNLYVFHFRCLENEYYELFQPVMEHILTSISFR